MNPVAVKIVGASISSTLIGAVAGYFYAKKRLTKEFEGHLAEEIDAARSFFTALSDRESPAEAVARLHPEVHGEDEKTSKVMQDAVDALQSYQQPPVNVVKADAGQRVEEPQTKEEEVEQALGEEHDVDHEPADETTERNIFIDGRPIVDSEWDPEAERDARRNGVPYVISEGEHSENEDNFDQIVLTYFALDDTLVDEDEKPIDDVDGMCGTENLKRFGQGSGDPNVVFVRNEQRAIDMEIIRSMGSYTKEVLGIDTDDALEHSGMPRRRRKLTDE